MGFWMDADDDREWVQPQVPVLPVVDTKALVLPTEADGYLSRVAYCKPGCDNLFWDLSYLWDVFRDSTDEKHGWKFLNYFKATAMMLSKEDELHIRGSTDRLLVISVEFTVVLLYE